MGNRRARVRVNAVTGRVVRSRAIGQRTAHSGRNGEGDRVIRCGAVGQITSGAARNAIGTGVIVDPAALEHGAGSAEDRRRSASADSELVKFASPRAAVPIQTVNSNGETFDRTVQHGKTMGRDRNLNAIAAAAAGSRDLEPVQVKGNAFGVDLDAVGLCYAEISRQIIGTGLIDNKVVVR